MIANEAFLGVKPASEYLFLTIACAVGSYFKDPTGTVTVWVSEHFTRAAPGGTGAAKCGGNYAASLAAQAEAARHGCEQVVFLDATGRRTIEELGGMNVFFAFEDGTLLTPPLSDSILPGITRDSVITLAQEAGLTVKETPYTIDAWRADVREGRLTEAFACGTAAVITPIGTVKGREDSLHDPRRRRRTGGAAAAQPARGHPARHHQRRAWLVPEGFLRPGRTVTAGAPEPPPGPWNRASAQTCPRPSCRS